MKRVTIIMIVIAATLLIAALPGGKPASHPFLGRWEGIDVDGSNLTLWITLEARSGGQVLEIRAHDDRTGDWWCGGAAKGEAVAVLEAENFVRLSSVWWCLPAGSSLVYFYEDTLTYNPATDTLTGGDETVYHR